MVLQRRIDRPITQVSDHILKPSSVRLVGAVRSIDRPTRAPAGQPERDTLPSVGPDLLYRPDPGWFIHVAEQTTGEA